jgi:hypothetical protein
METTQLGDLTAVLDKENAGSLRVRLSGRSSSREAGKTLAPLFDRVLSEAKSEARVLALHFEKLEYFNSSTIAALVQFIRAAQVAGVPMRIVYDGTQKWQALSFDALKRAMKPFESGTGPTVHFVCPND